MDYQENLKYEKTIGSLWQRDWEFFFRGSDILWAKIATHQDVISRRKEYNAQIDGFDISSSDYEISRFSSDLDSICNIIGKQWARLFDNWISEPQKFIFDDGFAALFLIRILWANNKILLRGHYNDSWKLVSTLERAKQKDDNQLSINLKNAQIFIDRISQLDFVKNAYGDSIPELHKQAILQHYGFPTELLDCTYSYDVALFFAEGAKDTVPVSVELSECGSIYAFPPYVLPDNATLISPPPAIMRTSLQKGVFISNLTADDVERLEKYKFTFRHKRLPIWNGLGDIQFGSPTGLSRYLLPIADPIEIIAEPLRNNKANPEITSLEKEGEKVPKLGETPEGVWLMNVHQNCVIEKQGGRQSIDMNLLINMCKSEPQSAYVALQILSLQLIKMLNGKTVAEAEGVAINFRLILGSTAMAYMISQGHYDGTIPKELMPIFNRYPIVVDCMNYIGNYNHELYGDD